MFVDEWTVIHFAIFCACAGYITFAGLKPWAVMLIALVAGYGWEFLELYFENRQDTYHGEAPINRWVSDPLFDLAGAGLGIFLVSRWKERNRKKPEGGTDE